MFDFAGPLRLLATGIFAGSCLRSAALLTLFIEKMILSCPIERKRRVILTVKRRKKLFPDSYEIKSDGSCLGG